MALSYPLGDYSITCNAFIACYIRNVKQFGKWLNISGWVVLGMGKVFDVWTKSGLMDCLQQSKIEKCDNIFENFLTIIIQKA